MVICDQIEAEEELRDLAIERSERITTAISTATGMNSMEPG